MARQEVDIGVEGNDGTGDSIRESFRKVNENFREIYAVVGKGGQITFTLLSDTPDDLAPFAGDGNAAYLPIVSQDGTEIEIRKLGSNELDETDTALDTIDIKVSQDGAIILKTKGVDIQLDKTPVLGGPLNAAGGAIGNIGTTQDDVNLFNDTHSAALTLDDLVIDKKFADQNYIRQQLPGENVLIAPEPDSVSFYEKTITVTGNGFAEVTSHGFTTGSNGKEFKISTTGPGLNWSYIRRVGGQPIEDTSDDTGLSPLGDGDSVYIKVINENTLAFFLEEEYVFEDNELFLEDLRLKISREDGDTSIIQIVDADYNPALEGFYSESQAVPRKSIVRRQGDQMEGALYLHDHPGDLAGAGIPNGITDLQAVSKLYVDSQSTESSTNIYVSTVGNDDQSVAPPGKEGSSLAYAYRTLGAAARKAEEIQISSPFEPGPYMQDLIYSILQNENDPPEVYLSQVTDFAVDDNDVGVLRRTNAKQLVNANIEFILAETIEWYTQNINNESTTSVGIAVGAGNVTFTIDWSNRVISDRAVQEELKNSIDAGLLDLLSGITATTVSTQVALEFFNNEYTKAQNGITREIYVAILNKARSIIEVILDNDVSNPYGDPVTNSPLQTIYEQQYIPFSQNAPADDEKGAIASTNGTLSFQMSIIGSGPLSTREDSVIRPKSFTPGKRFVLEFNNGTNDNVDQGDPKNTDIRTGKILRGKTTGALGRVVSYTQGGGSDDLAQIEMLNSKEFLIGENIELGNAVNERQITIHVETGQYEEDYPIRLPAQTSLVGNEMRRTIIRPKKRVSQSPWSGVYFYRDREFDGLTGDDTSITGIPDNNIPSSGEPYTNPLTGELDGYFGRHYLFNPSERKNVYGDLDINKYTNLGNYIPAAVLIERNRDYIVEEIVARITWQLSIPNNDYLILTGWGNPGDPKQDRYRRQFRNVLDLVVRDLREGGDLGALEAQGELFFGLQDFPGEETVIEQSLSYINNILKKVLINEDFVRDSNIVFPAAGGDQYKNENLVTAPELLDVIDVQLEKGIITRQFDLLKFAVNEDFNPAKRSTDVDVFLMNDATIVRQLSVQGHGGFMTVLDPEGQILTKSPYIQTGSSFSQSVNRQAFRGGMLVDAFCANTPMKVVSIGDSELTLPNYLVLKVEGEIGSGLYERKPKTPAPFYIDGIRYQVNDIIKWETGDGNLDAPSATLLLDPNSGPVNADGESLGWTLTIPAGGYPITLQTAGNRSQLGNDFTQVNDLGYGLVTINGGISEMVSMFTYYCHGAYYAGNGGQIRSTTGSNCNGVYGLIAEGSDPNEVPDDVLLENDMMQSALSFSAEIVLELPTALSLSATPTPDIVANAATNPTGYGRTVFSSDGKKVYLTDVRGTFTQGDSLFTGLTFTDYEDPQTGTGGTDTTIDIDVVDATGYVNDAEQLYMFVYDTEHPPEGKGEITFLHSNRLARYEIASVQKADGILVDGYTIDSSEYTFGAITRDVVTLPDASTITEPTPDITTEATIVIAKSALNGGTYKANIFEDKAGNNYKVGDTFTILGSELNGTDGVNNAIVTVEEVGRTAINIQNGVFTGVIRRLSVTGTPSIIANYTPQRDGQVYKLNFSSSNDRFDNDGLEAAIPIDQYVGIRQNANHIFKDVGNIETLTIRPSTAVNFQDDPEDTYRSISFGRNDSVGNTLLDTETLTGFDAGFDYIRMIVSEDNIIRAGADLNAAVASTTLGNTIGDTTIAIDLIPETRDQWRLNNNLETDLTYRPDTVDYINGVGKQFDYTAELPKVFEWQGKKHYVYNYREINFDSPNFNQTNQFGEENSFAIVDIKEIKEVILPLSKNATWTRLAGTGSGLRAAVVRQRGNTTAYGKVKISGTDTNEITLYDVSAQAFDTTGQLEISYNTSTSDFNDADFTNSTWEDLSVVGSSGGAVPTEVITRDTNLTGQTGDGIAASLSTGTTDTNIIRAGLQDGSPATITINISTCRATGHDFLDIGTGGYNTTNYPNVILGIPAALPQQANEVQERNKGRVFYMSTDQDGFFRVGRFFTVDQGTGTVSFAASIALSDVDGIGFKRGVVVTEFSSDSSMADNAIDSVPTESAVRGYVTRRLGVAQDGTRVNNPLGPSVITQNGAIAFTGDQSMGGNRLTTLAPINLDTSDDRDAVPKDYVDSRSEAYNAMVNLRDVSTFTAEADQLLGFSNSKKAYFKDFSQGADFSEGNVLTDSSLTSYYGLILGRIETYDPQYGNIVVITFQPGPDELADVQPFGYSNGEVVVQTTATVYAGTPTFDAQGNLTSIQGQGDAEMISGPYNEVINMAEEPFRDGVPTSDIRFSTRRLEDDTNFNSYRGEWDNTIAYSVGNIVAYTDDPGITPSLYQVSQPNPPAGTLPTDDAYWNAYTDTVREEPTAYLEFQINPEVIVDADVNPDAEIQQSKLLMQETNVFVENLTDVETIPAGEIESGIEYEIVTAGDTDFTNVGSPNSDAGQTFIATDDGVTATLTSTTGTVKRVLTVISVAGLVDNDDRAVQAELGLSKFDGANFKVTRGHVQIKDNGITLDKIQQLAADTVIANESGSTATPTEVTFSNVVDQGFGIQHSDLPSTDSAGTETADYTTAGVMTRVAEDDYTIIPATTSGTKNSFVKTSNTGQVTALSYALNSGSNEIIAPTGTSGLTFKNPKGGTILTAEYNTTEANPMIFTSGSLNVGGIEQDDGSGGTEKFTQSTIQSNSSVDGTEYLASYWAYHSFIEAPGEKGSASTGIAIGAGSGKANTGEVVIVVANSTTDDNDSIATFDVAGLSVAGSISAAGNISATSGSVSASTSVSATTSLSAGTTLTVGNGATFGGGYGSTGVSISNAGAISMNGNLTIDGSIVAGSANQDIGSSGSPFRDIYGDTFSGTAATAKYADLAENYVADADYEPGTVLVFGGESEVTVCTTKGDTRVAGVVSTDPAYLMNSHQEGNNVVALALTGRVPCKVIGKVRKGDILVTSAVPGYAIVNNTPSVGTVIGKAVGVKDDEGKGVVEVVVGRV